MRKKPRGEQKSRPGVGARRRTARSSASVSPSGVRPRSAARVIVKFNDSVDIPYDDSASRYLERGEIGPWRDLSARFHGIVIRPLFRSVTPSRLRTLVAQARRQTDRYSPP